MEPFFSFASLSLPLLLFLSLSPCMDDEYDISHSCILWPPHLIAHISPPSRSLPCPTISITTMMSFHLLAVPHHPCSHATRSLVTRYTCHRAASVSMQRCQDRKWRGDITVLDCDCDRSADLTHRPLGPVKSAVDHDTIGVWILPLVFLFVFSSCLR